MFGYDTLTNHYQTNFSLWKYHGYDLKYLDEIMPWERMVYISLLEQYVRAKEQERKDRENHR